MALELLERSGDAARPFLDDLARLRIQVFREFPYLYDGDAAYEARYLSAYFAAPESYLAVVRDGEMVVGASTALPAERAPDDVTGPLGAAGLEPVRGFYYGESVLLPEYRGTGWGGRFFEVREAAVRAAGRDWAAFCAVERPPDHPLRPPDYRPLDGFWERRGFERTDILTAFSWRDAGETAESRKLMRFWVKQLGGGRESGIRG